MRGITISFGLLLAGVLYLTGCTQADRTTDHGKNPAAIAISTESKLLSPASDAYLDNEKQQAGASAHPNLIFARSGRGVLYIEPVENKWRVVHNGKPGRSYQMVGDLAISNDGSRAAYVAHHNDKFRKIISDGAEGPLFLDIGMPVFSPDGKQLVYTIVEGEGNRLVINHKLFPKENVSMDFIISPDSRYLAYVEMMPGDRKKFVINDFSLQDRKEFPNCGETVTSSADHSRVAVGCSENGVATIKLIDVASRSVIDTISPPAKETVVRKAFAPDNGAFIYSTQREDYQRFLHYKGKSEPLPKGAEIMSEPLMLRDPDRVGAIIGDVFKVRFQSFFGKEEREKEYGYISDFIASKDGRHHAYIATNAGEDWMRAVVDGHEGPRFDKIVSPIFSPDGRFLVYRARQSGKRFLVVSDLKGAVVSKHKEYEMVFQPVFTQDGSSVAYGVLDGTDLWWKVEKLR